ncbi:MAG TPA: sugar phosphate isomerase/epimerase family protein [Terriglobia bacterium]|nr:sugar phosphate isomerase/epimerase family protein [Terriglobia bacterium]
MPSSFTRRAFLRTSLAACVPLVARNRASGATPGVAPGPGGWKLGIITDEITQKLETALDFITEYKLHGCELREMWGRNIMNLGAADLDRARKLIADHGLAVSDIGSPVFKWNLPQMPAKAEKRDTFNADFTEKDADDLLKRSFDIAHSFGTRKVRIFSYWRVEQPEKAYPFVRDRLASAAELAGKNAILLVLENEHECNIGTGREAGKLLAEIDSPHLKVNWDPANAVMLGEVPYPDGYQAVRGRLGHMHVKDVRKGANGKLVWAPVGGGFIDWRGQFKALRDDGYNETISLETHYKRPDGNTLESTRESLLGLLKIVEATPRS